VKKRNYIYNRETGSGYCNRKEEKRKGGKIKREVEKDRA